MLVSPMTRIYRQCRLFRGFGRVASWRALLLDDDRWVWEFREGAAMDVVCLREETSKTVVAMYQARFERLSRESLGRLWLLSSLRETVISRLDET